MHGLALTSGISTIFFCRNLLLPLLFLLTYEVQSKPQSANEKVAGFSNCFSLVDDASWSRIIRYDPKIASLKIFVNETGPRVLTCLQEQGLRISLSYELELKAISGNDIQILDKRALSVQQWLKMAGRDGRSNEESVSFHYILLQGNYSIRFRLCDRDAHFDEHGCETESVESAPIPMNRSFANLEQSWCLTGNDLGSRPEVMKYEPVVAHGGINFSFAFTPCHKILPYEEAQISVFQQTSDNRSETCEEGFKILQSSVPVVQAHLVGQVDQSRIGKPTHQAVISYQTPDLDRGYFYCLQIRSVHPICQVNFTFPVEERPPFCLFTSAAIFLEDLPFISQWVPFCTSHFQCGWLYITVVGTAAFLLSFILALICNLCCCKNTGVKQRSLVEESLSPSNLDTLKLTDLRPKRNWAEVHQDFYRDPPANPGKILLLYSPDSTQFKELQGAFRSFLELACHCVVLDLFDDELLEAIAYDPEAWIDQLLRDDRFKVIVVCSQGAYKRHQAILNGEVLNIPNTSSLDGLFSAGLRFLQARHYDKGRLSLARYEMLHLSSADFHFDDLGADREFAVPSELHQLFCWIHNYEPLDLLGKPWAQYNLELQLLQDALKKARIR